jgi:hypothetical protein
VLAAGFDRPGTGSVGYFYLTTGQLGCLRSFGGERRLHLPVRVCSMWQPTPCGKAGGYVPIGFGQRLLTSSRTANNVCERWSGPLKPIAYLGSSKPSARGETEAPPRSPPFHFLALIPHYVRAAALQPPGTTSRRTMLTLTESARRGPQEAREPTIGACS